jgi:hypothetical protein
VRIETPWPVEGLDPSQATITPMNDQGRETAVPLDWDADSVVQRTVEAVATREGKDVTQLAPMANGIGPEALAKVFDGPDRDQGSVAFEYAGRGVTVYAHGEIVVE